MLRIVVVDQDADLSMALARALDRVSVQIEVVTTEAQVLAASSPEPAMVFVRTRAGDALAERVIGRLRACHPSVPVAVVASEASMEEESALRRQGILCYLQEPVSDHVLQQVVCGAAPGCGFGWLRAGVRNPRRPIREPFAAEEIRT